MLTGIMGSLRAVVAANRINAIAVSFIVISSWNDVLSDIVTISDAMCNDKVHQHNFMNE